MNSNRKLQATAFALAISVTLGTLGALNLLATEQHAATLLAKAQASQSSQAAAVLKSQRG